MRANQSKLTADENSTAEACTVRDVEARTTFANIINGLNRFDDEYGGYFKGNLAILSSEWHIPRIAEMIRAFGLDTTQPLAAERVLKHFGYELKNIYKRNSWFERTEATTYNGQFSGLQNLQDNPAYVTFELCEVRSDRRLKEMAMSLKKYYREGKIEIPSEYQEIYDMIPDKAEETMNCQLFRDKLRPKLDKARKDLPKHGYTGAYYDYPAEAELMANATDVFLETHLPKIQAQSLNPVPKVESPSSI
ncbi:hypothetical protein COY59_05480 [Candidatus Gottesmanbacteria bacterium CG_4_10_14_0_8_um_filter_37_24]|uniref:DUF218 domain-containing protein n=2 Tax=Candidatus Gottesmaniibacteriota TaxID=1752720 RepID=A0A2M7RQR2_9BACT|nr:MAG: hypothetical protein AUJ73_03150 [Candidatus Gottesmanbacteria bacterium CG1_02_37_22]PIP33206.1 MAG: hypothetical protein COX23_00625 [Candidatus Gottesmanbacteria bacterium CG23_combo_of_CG06-09_8_20_14_all_37_19]PIZ02304.1 MAG: hypothetical protein COY59_05480 [Candidatus Gottesmanbacteria bacterium CG_4_10_14_0_8_um_filter_37_24]